MERPKGISRDRKKNTVRAVMTSIYVLVIIIFHIVGMIGFSTSAKDLFTQIVPFHLLLMTLVIVLSHEPLNTKFLVFAVSIYIAGYLVEWIGVHTGYLFGTYWYGETLGAKLFDIPLMIGVNWFLLVYATGVSMQRYIFKNIYSRVFVGAAVLVILDFLIEPVAIDLDQWHWEGFKIPGYNYLCWFIISAAMLYAFERCNFKKQTVVGPVFLLTQFVFFIVLHWI